MATNIGAWAASGLIAVQIAGRHSSGYIASFANLLASDVGVGSGMHRILGAVSAALPTGTTNRVPNRGDNKYRRTFNYEGEPGDYVLTHEATDKDAENFLTGAVPYTLGEWEFSVGGRGNVIYQDTITLLTRDAQSDESASDGAVGYDNLFVLSSQYNVETGEFAFQSPGSVAYNGTPQYVDTLPWGVDIIDANEVNDGRTYETWSEFPLSVETFIGNNVLTAIPLTYTPIQTSKVKAFNFATGAELTVSSVNVGAKTATLSAAPASGVIVVLIYETRDLI